MIDPFHPFLKNPHLQTLMGVFFRSKKGITFQRQRLDTPDGDFIDLDFADGYSLPDHAPLVLLLHGLEGSARGGYAYETYRQLAQCGIRSVGMNFRSCSGEMNRLPHTYHAGETGDIDFVQRYLDMCFPRAPKGIISFSLGANMMLKFLGELGETSRIQAAVAVSPPFDLLAAVPVMEQGTGRIYMRGFVSTLQRKAFAKIDSLRHLIDMEAIAQAKTVRDFDEAFIVPLFGFRDAQDYYRRTSCAQFLPAIRVPTLLLRALDDPFFDPYDTATIPDTSYLIRGLTLHGGHVGFVERLNRFWAERQAARFFERLLL